MSDNHEERRPSTPVSEVVHRKLLSEDLSHLLEQQQHTDVTFIVDDHKYHAHRIVLLARSEYFRALLFGGMKESQDNVPIHFPDTTSQAFECLLKYIYTGRASLKNFPMTTQLELLGLVHKCGFVDFEQSISDYLQATLDIKNVCDVYNVARFCCLSPLCEACLEFMDRNAAAILAGDALLSLCESALQEVVARDSFYAPELYVFKAVKKWVENTPGCNVNEIMSSIRLQLITLPDLLNDVRPTGLVAPDPILDAIKSQSENHDAELNHRGCLLYDENVSTLRHGAQVIKGEMRHALLDGDVYNYDLDLGYTRHMIEDQGGVVIKLGRPFIVNHIQLLLWDRDMRSYSYFIETSMDEKNWTRIADYSKYLCRAWQTIHFSKRVVRYLRIVGTYNTVNNVFHLVTFECLYTRKQYTTNAGIIAPHDNVATVQRSASVIEGVSRSRDALLNGDTQNYDWDSGYTCHQIGSGAIVIQLAQPYLISSIRLLLWDCDSRTYSYYIEASTDQHTWTTIVDKRNEACRSWQSIRFEPTVMTFIRLIGTHNTANEVFHCVHFECPASGVLQVDCAVAGKWNPAPVTVVAAASAVTEDVAPMESSSTTENTNPPPCS